MGTLADHIAAAIASPAGSINDKLIGFFAALANPTLGDVLQFDGTVWTKGSVTAAGGISKTVIDAADDLIVGTANDTVARLAVGASTIIAKLAAGGIKAATPAEIKTLLAIAESDVTNLTTDLAAKVAKSLFDANTVLAADTDDTPAAVTMGASTILARLAAGNIKAASVAEIVTLLALASTNISDFTEAVQDIVGALVTQGVGITVSYNDAGAIETISLTQVGASPVAGKTGEYVWVAGSLSTVTPTEARLVYVPWVCPVGSTSIDQLAAEVTTLGTVGAVVRLGMYDSASGRPTAKLVDAGTIDGTSATVQTAAANMPVAGLTPGKAYFLASAVQGAAASKPIMRSITGHHPSVANSIAMGAAKVGFFEDGITGALPANAGALSNLTSGAVAMSARLV